MTPPQKTQTRSLLSGSMDDMDQQPTPTQPTQPKGSDPKTGQPYEPVEIPVPKRKDVEGLLEKLAKTPDPDREK